MPVNYACELAPQHPQFCDSDHRIQQANPVLVVVAFREVLAAELLAQAA